MIHFPRPRLAREMADLLLGQSMFSDAHNGLFLAAPRRTGKTTFLQHDLKPELESRKVLVIYLDLWSNQRRDPGDLIAEAIGLAIQAHLGVVARTTRKAGIDKVTIAGALSIDASKIGQVDGSTLPDALKALHQQTKAPIALIIDEAQHALTSEAGEAAMAALKSARDQLNGGGKIGLMLIMSGSDRDKLIRLVNNDGAPFFGSEVRPMPELDTDFIAHVTARIEEQRPELAPVDQAKLYEAFQVMGCRPQFFMERLGQVLSPLVDYKGRFEDALLRAAQDKQRADEAQMDSDYLGLKPLEQLVLWRMLEQGKRFRPYDGDSLSFYTTKMGKNVTAAQVQNALESLRDRTPALVWKSAGKEYAVQDAAMHQWFDNRVQAGQWPPQE
ncbi:MAG: ATP-binding protein [Acidobacteriota bacterium]